MSAATKHKPPQSPRLSIYKWRLTMIASLAHRASGMLLVAIIPLALWLLLTMAHDETAFIQGSQYLHHPLSMLLIWAACVALFYHFVNGLRFLALDMGYGESRAMMKLSAKLVLGSTLIVAVVLAVLL